MPIARITGPAVAFQQRVRRACAGLRFDRNPSILLAVSGGIDSVALLDVMVALRGALNAHLAVLHIHHGLRATADEDARFVGLLAERRELPFYLEHADVIAHARREGLSIEMAGRVLRYRVFRTVAETNGYEHVATAHTMSDNLETVLLRLVRGGGAFALAGIPSERTMGERRSIVRPMLTVTRDDVVRYARARRLQWREDATNLDVSIPRNFIRHRVVPLITEVNPRAAEAVARSSDATQELLRFLRPMLDKAKRELCLERAQGERLAVAIPRAGEYLYFLRSFALHELLGETFASVFEMEDVDRLEALVARQTGAKESLAGGLTAVRDRDRLVIRRPSVPSRVPVALAIGEEARVGSWTVAVRRTRARGPVRKGAGMLERIDAGAVGTTFAVRTWQPGDAFVPLGMTHPKNVSDFLTDRKVPADVRPDTLVLESDGRIVWVCGHRIDDRVKITAATRAALELSITRTPAPKRTRAPRRRSS